VVAADLLAKSYKQQTWEDVVICSPHRTGAQTVKLVRYRAREYRELLILPALAGQLSWDLPLILVSLMPPVMLLATLMLLAQSVPPQQPADSAASLILQPSGSQLPDPSIAVEFRLGDWILVPK
jgi:hypothetical protein